MPGSEQATQASRPLTIFDSRNEANISSSSNT
jgi:hypothetical protein